jgi:hypothetical protein
MTRDDRLTLIVMATLAALLCLCASAVLAADPPRPQLPAGYSCADVRAKVAEYGKAAAWAWAFANGYTLAQIREARKCLR